MKLYTTDNSELMDITEITTENGMLMITGTIMGAVPVRAMLKPEDMRMALRQMSVPTMARAAMMPMQGTSTPWLIGGGMFGLYSLLKLFRGK